MRIVWYFSGMPQVMPLAKSRERAEEAHTLRVLGFSWREIAGALGYTSVGGAQQAVASHRKRNPPPSAKDTLAEILERRRLTNQRVLRQLAVAEAAGDSAAVASLARTVNTSDSELAKLLGLNAAERVDVTVGRSPAELLAQGREAQLAALAERGGGAALPAAPAPEPIDAEVVE